MRHLNTQIQMLKYINQMKRKNAHIQIHQESSNPLASVLGVKFIKEVIKMSIIFLPNFIVENLKTFAML